MAAGGTLPPAMAETFKVHDVSSPSVSPSASAPDIQIPPNESEGQFGIDIKQSEDRPGMFRRMSLWFRSR